MPVFGYALAPVGCCALASCRTQVGAIHELGCTIIIWVYKGENPRALNPRANGKQRKPQPATQSAESRETGGVGTLMEVDVYEFLGKWGDTVRAMQATVPDDDEEEAVV